MQDAQDVLQSRSVSFYNFHYGAQNTSNYLRVTNGFCQYFEFGLKLWEVFQVLWTFKTLLQTNGFAMVSKLHKTMAVNRGFGRVHYMA